MQLLSISVLHFGSLYSWMVTAFVYLVLLRFLSGSCDIWVRTIEGFGDFLLGLLRKLDGGEQHSKGKKMNNKTHTEASLQSVHGMGKRPPIVAKLC